GPDGRVSAARLGPLGGPVTERLDCDLLLSSGGWNPAAQLYSQAGGQLHYHRELGCFVPAGPVAAIRVAGSANGRFGLPDCLADGAAISSAALAELGIAAAPAALPTVAAQPDVQPSMLLWAITLPGNENRAFVDLQRDSTVAGVRRAVGAGLRSVEHVKRYTTIGTAHDQGKTSGLIASAIVAESLDLNLAEVGLSSARPPYLPIAFAALAGRDRDQNFDPIRVTAMHDWHLANGAVFENVGQWQRPRYFPQLVAGQLEDQDAAVARECVQARTSVAMMDGSTLGKVSVQGLDAGEFLDRMYTNVMSSLRPGSIRYGVLCGLDGMVLDDGTVARISATEFLLTTTTGNAATVLDWLEEFAQTEWPDLQVHLTSVTEHWSTVALVGPLSRTVLAGLAPDLDVSAEGFPFMTWRDATVAGLPARIYRISFCGELAYEINVSWWYGQQLWESLLAAGQPHQLAVYGTETMHVLRAEKGYPIIGQDTDGTVTPQDLGLDWLVSKKKPDFVGKRSQRRPENLRPDRKQLVGLLPLDGQQLLDEGAQLLAAPQQQPARMLGHVTSSYRSQALGRTFALALLRSGRQRIGQQLLAWQDGTIVPVMVTDPVLYDPAGDRRDG
ncbi:MAG: glycine cleavage T C-terminal barrel domain-containing protein, partial [Jatrophihabitantaceae bacterium]